MKATKVTYTADGNELTDLWWYNYGMRRYEDWCDTGDGVDPYDFSESWDENDPPEFTDDSELEAWLTSEYKRVYKIEGLEFEHINV